MPDPAARLAKLANWRKAPVPNNTGGLSMQTFAGAVLQFEKWLDEALAIAREALTRAEKAEAERDHLHRNRLDNLAVIKERDAALAELRRVYHPDGSFETFPDPEGAISARKQLAIIQRDQEVEIKEARAEADALRAHGVCPLTLPHSCPFEEAPRQPAPAKPAEACPNTVHCMACPNYHRWGDHCPACKGA